MRYRTVLPVALAAATILAGAAIYSEAYIDWSRLMAQTNDRRSGTLPLPRDPEIAVREEYDMARKRGTAEAFELFIARHPNHALAAEARRELERIRDKSAR